MITNKNLYITGLDMAIDTTVQMFDGNYDITGVTMEKPCKSPTAKDPNRLVVRIKWEDGSESIENLHDLY